MSESNKFDSPYQYFHLSNLLTYSSVAIGFGSLFYLLHAEEKSPAILGISLSLCSILDTLDGKFANLIPRTARQKLVGVQLDSFADIISFGIVPMIGGSLLLYSSNQFWIYSILAIIYILSTITRLSFFNSENTSINYFIGMPTTICGLIWSFLFFSTTTIYTFYIATLAMSVLMVAPIKIKKNSLYLRAVFIILALLAFMLNVQKLSS